MASETETAQTSYLRIWRVAGPRHRTKEVSKIPLESGATVGESPVCENFNGLSGIPSTTGHEESRGNQGGPSPKAKYSAVTDSEQVP